MSNETAPIATPKPTPATILVAIVKDNSRRIQINNNSINIAVKGKQESERLIYNAYELEINALKSKRDKATRESHAIYDAKLAILESELKTLGEPIDLLKRILYFLSIDATVDLTIPDDAIQQYDSWGVTKHVDALPYLMDEKYMKVRPFIVGNKKPTNKYSLCLLGTSIFGRDLT